MKKIIFREIFWLIFSAILSLLISFLFIELVDLSSTERQLKSIEKIFSVQLYLIGVIVSFVCIYITRVLVYTLKVLIS
jgi:hypothetical protein